MNTMTRDPFAGLESDNVGASGLPAVDAPPLRETYQGPSTGAYWEPCVKCRGTGQTRWGTCFKCQGKKGKSFKSSPEQRSARRASALQSKVEKIEAFKVEHSDVWAWMDENARSDRPFPPAVEMLADLHKYGSLFDSRLEFARRMIQRRADVRAAREEVKRVAYEEAPVVGDALQKAFDVAIAKQQELSRGQKGKRTGVKLYFGDLCSIGANPAKYPGVLFVNGPNFGDHYGRVVNGKFITGRDCPPAVTEIITDCLRDPKAAAIKYGQRFGRCTVCGAKLKANESIERAMGPVCASKFGW